jgi:hypothetical protein
VDEATASFNVDKFEGYKNGARQGLHPGVYDELKK